MKDDWEIDGNRLSSFTVDWTLNAYVYIYR